MLNNKTVAVVVPAFNEENQITIVLKNIPSFVDHIVVVNDCSTDETKKIVKNFINKNQKKYKKKNSLKRNQQKSNKYSKAEDVLEFLEKQNLDRLPKHNIYPNNKKNHRNKYILINHHSNEGVGAAVSTGYFWCHKNKIDCTAVMDGDGQMDPKELEKVCLPVVTNKVDYVKANRLSHRSAFFVIPKIRYFGNSILSLLTKIASGYWHISDTQSGFTAISYNGLNAIRIHNIYHSYGYPNDILVKLNIAFCSIMEVSSKPVYNIGEKSKMKIIKVIPTIAWLLIKSFIKRLYIKYLLRDFHPLFLLYHFSFFLLLINTKYLSRSLLFLAQNKAIPLRTLIVVVFLSISGFQSLFFAMWMDMMDNERLYKTN